MDKVGEEQEVQFIKKMGFAEGRVKQGIGQILFIKQKRPGIEIGKLRLKQYHGVGRKPGEPGLNP